MEDPLGEHYIIELYECDRNVLNDSNKIESTLVESARIAGATIIDRRFHQFNPHGVSGVVVIAESHLSIHTWPEHGYAALDLFTCSHGMHIDRALELIKDTFQPADIEVRLVRRGVINKKLRGQSQPRLESLAV